MNPLLKLCLIFSLALISHNVLAQSSQSRADTNQSDSLSWDQLSEEDRQALTFPVREQWERSSPERRRLQLDRARLYKSLTPEQRKLAREGAERFRRINAGEQTKLREVFQQIQALPPEQRRQVQAQWKAMTPGQRQEWIKAGGPGKVPAPSAKEPATKPKD